MCPAVGASEDLLPSSDTQGRCGALQGLRAFADSADFQKKWREVKLQAKKRAMAKIQELTGVELNPSSMLDVQVGCPCLRRCPSYSDAQGCRDPPGFLVPSHHDRADAETRGRFWPGRRSSASTSTSASS